MGDIYDIFSLPAPPPPTWLSFHDGPTRARLPNFLASDDPITAARTYLHGQIMFNCIPSLWTHVKIVTAVAGLVVSCAIAVIVRRLLQRSLWIFRLTQTERGPLIVPNAIMIFAAIEGLFVIIFLALINSVYYAWEVKKQPLSNLILWISLTWSPLIAGPIWNAFGLWHARPTSSTPRNTRGVQQSRLFGMKMPFSKALLISIFWLLVPIIQLMSVFGPAFTGNNHRSEAVRLYYKWMEEYASATELTRPMLIGLQSIWVEDLKAFYWLAITMFIWSAWTVALFAGYIFVNIRLLLPLRTQLLALEDRNSKISGPSMSQIESVQLPLETPRLRSLVANYVGSRIETVDFQEGDGNKGAKAVNEHWGLRVKDLQEDAVNTSFFPPTKPSAVIRPATDSETSERYLRAAYQHFLFQGVTISTGIFYFGQISLYIALTVYSYNERRMLGRAIDIAFMQAMWGCMVFTFMVFISITMRTYEPVLVNLLNSNNSSKNNNSSGPNRTLAGSRDRSFMKSKLASLRLFSGQDQKKSYSSSNATVVNSPTFMPRDFAMDTLKESGSPDRASKRWQAEPESLGFTANRGSIFNEGTGEITGRNSPSISFTPMPITPPPRRSNSAQGQTHLRKADVLVSTRTPEYEVPAHIPRDRSSPSPLRAPIQIDESWQPLFTSNMEATGFLASTSSLNDRSLREMSSMGTGTLRSLNELSTSTLPLSASQVEAPSPAYIGFERNPSISPSSSISTATSHGIMPTGGLSIGASLTPAGLEFVTALAGAGSMQPEEEWPRARRSTMREMVSDSEATVLPPPPRAGRRLSRTSIST
ncbi:unnamed protein product [Tilletia controversa]|nr:unnamed protein product [Tilletia controversa]CAD6975395.1 unnamed protein product [Tilletia controversa]